MDNIDKVIAAITTILERYRLRIEVSYSSTVPGKNDRIISLERKYSAPK